MADPKTRRRTRAPSLPRKFPHRPLWQGFLREFARSPAYWYVPKVRVLTDENVQVCAAICATLIEHYEGSAWDSNVQDELLSRLVRLEVLRPYVDDGDLQDRTALTRIWKVFLEYLGLAWVTDQNTLTVTGAGAALAEAESDPSGARAIAEGQVRKFQYPNPLVATRYRGGFDGLLPHLFLLCVLQECANHISQDEWVLFLNLAQSQADLPKVTKYVTQWRKMSDQDQETLLMAVDSIPAQALRSGTTRRLLISRDSAYQRGLFGFASYLATESSDAFISVVDRDAADAVLAEAGPHVKPAQYQNAADWIAYYGDPAERPTWGAYIKHAIRSANTKEEAEQRIRDHEANISPAERTEVSKLQIEKAVELSYAQNSALLHTLEEGLQFVDRQVTTPVGRIDLLCRAVDGMYVVVEIKAGSAVDAVFGQILRYMGWIHRHFDDGENNVRGIILASQFDSKAQYSRVGLLRDDANQHLKFHRHVFAGEEV